MQKVKRLSDNLSSIERDFQGQSESFFGVHEGQGIEEVWENAEMRMEDRNEKISYFNLFSVYFSTLNTSYRVSYADQKSQKGSKG